MKNQFKVGQGVVHLSHGVGKVKGLETREFGPGKVQSFYILEIQDCGASKKVFVPVDSASQRLRAIITKEKAEEIVSLIAFGKVDEEIDHATWNRRYRNYMELIHTGEIENVAKVYMALKSRGEATELSFGERKLIEQAYSLLTNELQLAGVKLPD